MSEDFDVVKGFYVAAQAADAAGILAVMHPDLEVHTAPGLPTGSGTYIGPQNALVHVWGAVFRDFDTAPYDETWQQTVDGTVVVTGHYRGTARATGRAYEAEFVHLWRVTDGLISWLHQYTDTARWREALAEPRDS